MEINKPKNILISPLDWGLGHTTRCIPIIRYIQRMGHKVLFAGNESQRAFIEDSIADITSIHMNGYNISYSRWNQLAQAGLLRQLPGIYKTIRAEHAQLSDICKNYAIHGIISDNRYGLYHKDIPSAIITHQPGLISGMGRIIDRLIQKVHYKQLEHFGEVWIPDAPGELNLGGRLSHTKVLPANTHYVGLLSRIEPQTDNKSQANHLLVLLSGPEPQRTNLARILWQQVTSCDMDVTFVEGSLQADTPAFIPSHVIYYKRITDKQLLPLLENCSIVLCRSGYSTLMDIATRRKKAILIPTPGQTEQEYLAKLLQDKGIYCCQKQTGFNLTKALRSVVSCTGELPGISSYYTMHESVIDDWLSKL